MKYVVIKETLEAYKEDLYIFPRTMAHQEMVKILKMMFPNLEIVSAGFFENHAAEVTLHNGVEEDFDKIVLFGKSESLEVESRLQDTNLFQRLSLGYRR